MSLASLAQATPPPMPQNPFPAEVPAHWSGDVIVKFRDGTPAERTAAGREGAIRAASNRARLPQAARAKRVLGNEAALVSGGGNPRSLIATLQARSDVEWAVPDTRIVRATNDTYWSSQWNLQEGLPGLSVTSAWQRTSGSGARVAVIDSGRTNPPDLSGRWLGGYDFVSDPTAGGDGNGRDGDATDTGDYCNSDPSSWHGTGVAGTIAALANNSRDIAGVAPASRVVPVRVLGRCGGYVSDLIDAMLWSAGIAVPGAPANAYPARVLNLSLASVQPEACSPAMQDAINRVRGRNALVVVAAGNEYAPAASYSPGNCQGVMTVAASNPSAQRSSFSNYGGPVRVAAPGGETNAPVPSLGLDAATTNNGAYTTVGVLGTSIAAPHVSGVAALLLAAHPSLTLAQLETLLTRTAEGADTCSGCGAGIVDANLALSWLPTVSSLGFAHTGLPGGEMVLLGAGLARVTSVTIGSLDAPIVGRSGDNRLVVRAPAHLAPGRYPVKVSNGMVTTTGRVDVGYVDLPRVVSLPTTTAAARAVIQVTGRGFLPGATVDLSGTPAEVTTVSPESLWFVVPAGVKGRVVVRVTTSQGTSSASKGSILTVS